MSVQIVPRNSPEAQQQILAAQRRGELRLVWVSQPNSIVALPTPISAPVQQDLGPEAA